MKYTLLADGTSDAVLIPIITWLLARRGVGEVEAQLADKYRLPQARDLGERIVDVLEYYPCDVLFIHRDAEAQSVSDRKREIATAIRSVGTRHIPVIPVRMTEAWLLFDERAIRRAAGNPNGKNPLQLPPSTKIESLVDPKQVLHSALLEASDLNMRRRSRFPVHDRVRRIADYIDDYSPLLELPAFQDLEKQIEMLGINRSV